MHVLYSNSKLLPLRRYSKNWILMAFRYCYRQVLKLIRKTSIQNLHFRMVHTSHQQCGYQEKDDLPYSHGIKKEQNSRGGIVGVPKRYILLLMIFSGFVNIYAMRVNLNVALVAMVNNQIVLQQGVKSVKVVQYMWSDIWNVSYSSVCLGLSTFDTLIGKFLKKNYETL